MDFFTTVSRAANVDEKLVKAGLDGVSLLPLLKNPEATLDREVLYWHYPHYHALGATPHGAIRRGLRRGGRTSDARPRRGGGVACPAPALRLARMLATCPDARFRDGARARALAERTANLVGQPDAWLLDTLAAAYAEKGDFETAIKWSTKAVELGTEEQKEPLRKELESYQQKKAWRESQSTEEKPNPPELPGTSKS